MRGMSGAKSCRMGRVVGIMRGTLGANNCSPGSLTSILHYRDVQTMPLSLDNGPANLVVANKKQRPPLRDPCEALDHASSTGIGGEVHRAAGGGEREVREVKSAGSGARGHWWRSRWGCRQTQSSEDRRVRIEGPAHQGSCIGHHTFMVILDDNQILMETVNHHQALITPALLTPGMTNSTPDQSTQGCEACAVQCHLQLLGCGELQGGGGPEGRSSPGDGACGGPDGSGDGVEGCGTACRLIMLRRGRWS